MKQYSFNEAKHLHTLDGVALTGTSTVVGVLAKPLTWWASGLAVSTMGWSNPKLVDEGARKQKAQEMLEIIKGFDNESYLKLLDKAYRAHSVKLDKSAEAGTDMHADLEAFVKVEMGILKIDEPKFPEKIKPFIDWTNENVKEFLWSEAHCFSEKLFVGGISDAGALLNDGTIALIDYKSSKEAYASHFIQGAGYTLQIAENGVWDANGTKNKKVGKISSIIIVPFGADIVKPIVRRDVEAHQEAFKSALQLYRLLASYEK